MPLMSFPKGAQVPSQASDLYSPVPLEGAGQAIGGLLGAFGGSPLSGAEDAAGGVLGGLRRAFSGATAALPEVDTALPRLGAQLAPKVGYQSLAQPKTGGVLWDVLDKAAQNSGQGLSNSPGSARLLDHYTKLIR